MSILPGIGGIGGSFRGGPPLTCSYLSRVTSSTNGTSYSFSSYGLGTASGDRHIVVIVYNTSATSSGSLNPTGVTVGGVSATMIGPGTLTGGGTGLAVATIWLALVPTGTTGTIAVDFDSTMSHCAVDGYSVKGAANVGVVDSDAGGGFGVSSANLGSVDYASGGVIIAGACSASNVSFTWSGVTERADATSESRGCSSAMDTKSTDGTAVVSITTSGSSASLQGNVVSIAAA